MKKAFFKKKKLFIFLIVIILVVIGVGYAFLTKTLSINSDVTMNKNSWNIYFDNVKVSDGSVSGTPELSSDKSKITFTAEISNPGDFYEFTADVINGGTIDAMVDSLGNTDILTASQKKYLDYSITYQNGETIENKDLLKSGETRKIKVRLTFKRDITESDLPTSDENLAITIDVGYIQADEQL